MFHLKNTVASQAYIFLVLKVTEGNVLLIDLETAMPSTIQMYVKVWKKMQLNYVT